MKSKRVKMRGRTTFGYGSKKKHRGGGSKGGKGFAGAFKHKRVFLRKYHPEHFQKKKFKSLRNKQFAPSIRSINLRDLNKIILEKTLKEVNLKELGYDKILAAGELTVPILIKNATFSERARQKVEKAGGTVQREPAEKEE